MGKIPLIVVALLLLGVFRLHSADLEGFYESLPIGGAPAAAAATLPVDEPADGETPDDGTVVEEEEAPDLALWFEQDAEADKYSQPLWAQVEELLTDAEGAAGWTMLCELATAATGEDRTAKPLPGALACSEDPSVTELQQLAVAILRTQASAALWMRSVPGYSLATLAARQGEVRLLCATGDATRGDDSEAATFAEICAGALDSSWQPSEGKRSDGPATFEALKAAYASLATVIAERDATADDAPVFFIPPVVETEDGAAEEGASDPAASGS